jgi:phosphate transport system permease protein
MSVATPLRRPPAPIQIPRVRPSSFTKRDLAVLGGAVSASFALVWLLYSQLLPFQGAQGFLLCWIVTFLLMYFAAVREIDGRVIARDRTMAALVSVTAVAIVVPLALILGYVGLKGLPFLRLRFFTTTMADIGPSAPSSQSGGLHAIVGTLEQVGIAMLISVPLGVLTAVYLNEVKGRLQRPVRIFVDAMSGTPSIVAGLFIYTVLVAGGGSFSGLAAALALSVLMLPTVTRTSEVVLRLVPDGLREASLALGSPQWKTVWRVVLPSARSGLITACILGVARVIGETAPLIMTAFGSSTMNADPFSGAQAALPLSAFNLFREFGPSVDRAWTFAAVLVLMVLILFVAARRIGRRTFGRN